MAQTLEESKIKEPPTKKKIRCSSFDSDCKTVENHLVCFMGSGRWDIGITDGYCPFIQNPN